MLYKKKKSTAKKSDVRRLTEKLDTIFSQYIRLRDSKPYGYKFFRCISCGRVLPIEKADNGHFFSRRHMSTRFDEDNCNAECSYDNRFNSEHLVGYEKNLKVKLGKQRFLLLEVKAHQTKQWSAWELEQLCNYYKKKIQEMKDEQAH